MSTLSVLELVQAATDELSLSQPTTAIGNTNSNEAQKLLRHLTRAIKVMARRFDWQNLRREHTFTTLATASQGSLAIPSDFLRMVERSVWNRTTTFRVQGPLTPEEYQARLAAVAGGVTDSFILRQNTFLLSPTPASGETIAYEYISKNVGTDTAGTTELSTFTLDTDLPYLDEELLILHLVWRYRKAEGQDYSEEFREAELMFQDMLKMDGSRRRLDMSGDRHSFEPKAPRTPDTLLGVS